MKRESAEAVVARQLMDCMTYTRTHTLTEETAAVPTASLHSPRDCLAHHRPCDNVPSNKSCVM